MNTLTDAKPVLVVCTRDLDRATAFYRDTLGLSLVGEDGFGAVFDISGTSMRLAAVADFVAHGHTILGFRVRNVGDAVVALAARGVAFLRVPGYRQDNRGILALPSGAGQVAWLKDPDGNVLSVTDV